MSWRDAAGEAAAERILDAAERLFAERGVDAVGMGDVAREAGCSRATLYRHVENRRALHVAYVHREARRIVAEVTAAVAGIADPGSRRLEAVLGTVRAVREAPQFAAWRAPEGLPVLTEVLDSSEVVDGFARAFLPEGADAGAGRWLVRVILSYVVLPGRDAEEERAQLATFVAPVLTGSRIS